MNKAPAFQFYAQDFLTGVTYLTNEEIGMYIKLLSKQWTDDKIPLKRIEFLIGKKWENVSEELQSKFKNDGEFLFNERLEKERKKQKEKSAKAKKSAERRWKKSSKDTDNTDDSKDNANAMRTHKKRTSDQDAIIEDEDRSMKNEDRKEKGGVGEKEKIDFEKVVEVFNNTCNHLPKVQKLTKKRKAAIHNRIKEYGKQKVNAVFKEVATSNFLNGESDRGWKADFDWVMNPNNFIKILEGKYQNSIKNGTPNSKSEPTVNRQSAETIYQNSQGWEID